MGKIKFCAQLGFALAILLLLQALLIPKYMESTQEGALIGEYYANAGGNDVIFIGDCEVYENFSPITLWNEYGIPSCIRGSPQQTIWQSYYLLEETLRYETPQVVVFNVLSMKYDTPESTGDPTRREAYNRLTLDSMRPSVFKWKAVQASLTADERAQDAQFSYLFPILRFHDRWSKLTAEDFTYWLKKDQISHNGYLMQTGIKPMTDAHPAPAPAGYQFGSASWDYLNRMERLCRAHGIKLVLIKAPTLYPVWWKEWDAQIRSYAQEKGLLYLNMTESLDEIGIDWSTDTYDAGLHLNVWGAEKAAFWFGRILATQCSLPDRRDDDALCARWAAKTDIYKQQKQTQLASAS